MKRIIALVVCALIIASIPFAALAADITFETGELLPNGVVGEEYYAKISARGAWNILFSLYDNPNGYNQFPSELTLSENGEITGIPFTSGVFKFSVWATYVSALSDLPEEEQRLQNGIAKTFTLIINGNDEILPIVVSTERLPAATVGEEYTAVLEADGTGPLMYRIYENEYGSNDFPAELTLSSDGTISGTPAEAGSFSFWIEVANLYEAVRKTFTLTVDEPERLVAERPVITAPPRSTECLVGESASLSVEASVSDGGTLTYQWYSTDGDGYGSADRIDGATGSVFSPPTDKEGSYYYFVAVTNTLGDSKMITNSAVASLTITRPPIIAPPEPADQLPLWAAVTLAVSITANVALAAVLAVTASKKRGDSV